MTYYYQNQCEDSCYSPCNYGRVYSYQSYDCSSPCTYQSYDCGSPCTYRSYECSSPCTYRSYECSSPCTYRSYRSYDCSSPCTYRSQLGVRGLYSLGNVCSSRCYYPYSSRSTRRYSYGGCYSC